MIDFLPDYTSVTALSTGLLNKFSRMSFMLLLMCSRDMKDKCQRLEPGCTALYTWQDPAGKRELIWKCPDKDKDFKDKLIKVYYINLLNCSKYC